MKILIVYSVIFTFFFIYLVITLTYQAIMHVLPGYPALWLRLSRHILHPTSLNAQQWLTQIFELVWNTFLIIGCCLFVRNTLRRVIGWYGARGNREPRASEHGMTAVHD